MSNAATIVAALKNVDANSMGTQSGQQILYSPPAATADSCTDVLTVTVPLRSTRSGSVVRGTRAFELELRTANGTAKNRITLKCDPPAQ